MKQQEGQITDQAHDDVLDPGVRDPADGVPDVWAFTRATVNSRIDRLVSSGTVIGFSVRVREGRDPSTVRAITLIEVHGRANNEVIRALRGFPEVRSLHTTNGGWDFVAEIEVDSLFEFDRLLGQIRSIDGIENSESNLLFSSVSP